MVLTKKHKEWWDTFIPRSLSGLILWLDDPNIPSNIIESALRISQWNDISGNDNHFIQDTGIDQPLRLGSEITFAVSEFLDGSANIANFNQSSGELFIVGRSNLITSNGSLFSVSDGSLVDRIAFDCADNSAGTLPATYRLFDADSATDNDSVGTGTVNTINRIINYNSDSSLWEISLDGVQGVLGVSNQNDGDWFGEVVGATSVLLADAGDRGNSGNSTILSVVCYNRKLTLPERLKAITFLNNRFLIF